MDPCLFPTSSCSTRCLAELTPRPMLMTRGGDWRPSMMKATRITTRTCLHTSCLMTPSTRLATDAQNADTRFVPTAGKFQEIVDLQQISGSSQRTSDHAVTIAEEHFASASTITIVVNIKLFALFQLLEGSKEEKPRNNISQPIMYCHDYLQFVANVVPILKIYLRFCSPSFKC